MKLKAQQKTWLALVLLSFVVYGAALTARTVLTPNIAVVSDVAGPQSTWVVQLRFIFLATEMVASLGGCLLLIAACSSLVQTKRSRDATGEC